MKALSLFLAIAITSSCSQRKTDTVRGDIDFSVTYYPDSSISEIVQKENSLLNGKTIKFDEFGTKLWEFNFVDDQQEGLQYFYSQGKLNFVVPYKKGKKNGWARRYTGPCGSISEEGQYENDKKNGLWYNYHDNELLEIGLYKNDSLTNLVHRNKKYLDRSILLPPITRDCAGQWRRGEE
jgi:antitoxin component YwqK of YwqJK toxin-antitoxin module